jgi:hypothetical protein
VDLLLANERLTQVAIAWRRRNGCSSEESVVSMVGHGICAKIKRSTRASGFGALSRTCEGMTWSVRIESGERALGNRERTRYLRPSARAVTKGSIEIFVESVQAAIARVVNKGPCSPVWCHQRKGKEVGAGIVNTLETTMSIGW